jgi:hypothetical protein
MAGVPLMTRRRHLLRDAGGAPARPRRAGRRAAGARHPARRLDRNGEPRLLLQIFSRRCSARCSSSSSSARSDEGFGEGNFKALFESHRARPVLILPPRAAGHMIFGLTLDQLDGGGQADLSFGMIDGHFVIGNGGVDVDVSGGAPTVTQMRVVLRVEYHDSGSGSGDNEFVTLWVNPVDEFSTPVIDGVAVDLLNSGGARLSGVSMRGGQMAGQPAYFDDLMVGFGFADVMATPASVGLVNDLAMNGLFYDPDNPGHGFNFVVHGLGLTVYYYGHTATGERLWLMSETFAADLEFDLPFELEMLEVVTGEFGLPQLPPTAWGTIAFNLADCDSGHASFSGGDGDLEMDFIRLSGMPGISCQ